MRPLQTDWEGHYLDGRTAARRPVTIRIMRLGLQVSGEAGDATWWPYEQIRQTQGFYAGEQVRLERGEEFAEALLVADASFLTHLRRMSPEAARRFHDPATRKARTRIIAAAAAGSLVILALVYLRGIPALAEFAASHVPVSWEERLGAAVVEHLAPPAGRCLDDERERILDGLVRTLSAPVRGSPYTIRVIVMDNPGANAFATPGGTIVLFRGLFEHARRAEELAGVLAHELQHVFRRHATRALIQNASTHLLIGALAGDAGGITSFGLEGARILGVMRYSRRNEEEADEEGMRLLLEAGVDPSGMVEFFEQLGQKEKEVPALFGYLSTHPTTADRIERLKALAGRSPRTWVRLIPDYDWSDMKRICQASAASGQPNSSPARP